MSESVRLIRSSRSRSESTRSRKTALRSTPAISERASAPPSRGPAAPPSRSRPEVAHAHRHDPVGAHVDRRADRVRHPDAAVAVEGSRRSRPAGRRSGSPRTPSTCSTVIRARIAMRVERDQGSISARALEEGDGRAGEVVRGRDRDAVKPPGPEVAAHAPDRDLARDELPQRRRVEQVVDPALPDEAARREIPDPARAGRGEAEGAGPEDPVRRERRPGRGEAPGGVLEVLGGRRDRDGVDRPGADARDDVERQATGRGDLHSARSTPT